MFWPFSAWINWSSDLKKFANSRPSALNFKKISRSLEQFFLTVGQNNFGNKVPFMSSLKIKKNKPEVCNFCTCNLKSTFRPQVVGHNSHWKTGLSPVWISLKNWRKKQHSFKNMGTNIFFLDLSKPETSQFFNTKYFRQPVDVNLIYCFIYIHQSPIL